MMDELELPNVPGAGETSQSFFSHTSVAASTLASGISAAASTLVSGISAASDASLALEKLRVANSDGQRQHIHRISRICGRVVSAKGLPRFDSMSLSDPFCVVKAIKGNNHTMNVHVTRTIMNDSTPTWDEEFDFEIRQEDTTEEIVGLRLGIYDADGPTGTFHGSNDFLGGADLDLASQKHARSVLHELELGGVITRKVSGGRRPRLVIAVTIYRETVLRPLPRPIQLKQSLFKMPFVQQVFGKVVQASDLPNREMLGLSDPFCIVRAVLISGEVVELYRTKVVQNSLQPKWGEVFQASFTEQEQPLLLLFDVWDEDDPNKSLEEGGAQHLGSAAVPLLSALEPAPRTRRLWLQGVSQRHETRYNPHGVPRNEPLRDRGKAKLSRQRSSHGISAEEKENRKTFNLSKGSKGFLQRLKDAVVEFKNQMTEQVDQTKRSVLTVELRSYVKSSRMPFSHIFQKPMFIHDADDLEKCLESPDWKRSPYRMPQQMESEHLERGKLSAQGHITFIYGAIHGASFLPLKLGQPPEAYCMVHAVSTVGERHFIHRTRAVKQMTSPHWSEAFYGAIPEDFEAVRLQISIHGATATNLMTKATSSLLTGDESNYEEDWFIGRAHVDLTTAMSGHLLNEEAPIQGGTIPKQERVTSGFRLQPCVGFEVMCERRLQPNFNAHAGDGTQMIPRRHHHLTRSSDPIQQSLPMVDNGQMPMLTLGDMELQRAAKEALELSTTGVLLYRKAQKADWTKLPGQDEEEEDLLGEQPVEKILQERGEALPSLEPVKETVDEIRVVDFTKRELLRQPRSLPLLKTKFHDQPELYKLGMTAKATRGRFSLPTAMSSNNVTRSLREKPLFSQLHWHEPADLPLGYR